MTNKTNEWRAARGKAALLAHLAFAGEKPDENPDDGDLSGVLTDLMHFANQAGVDFHKALDRASVNFTCEEQEGEDDWIEAECKDVKEEAAQGLRHVSEWIRSAIGEAAPLRPAVVKVTQDECPRVISNPDNLPVEIRDYDQAALSHDLIDIESYGEAWKVDEDGVEYIAR